MKCRFCGKDGLRNQGAKNLHEFYCKANPMNQNKEKIEKCNHEWQLLDSSITLQKRALLDGYVKYCPKCKEVE